MAEKTVSLASSADSGGRNALRPYPCSGELQHVGFRQIERMKSTVSTNTPLAPVH